MELAGIAQGALSSGLGVQDYMKKATSNFVPRGSGNLVSVPKYGEITYDDLEILKKKGLVRVDGVDANGKLKVTPLKNKNNSGFIQLTR